MNKPELAQKVLEYWYLAEFLSQPEFPLESEGNQKAESSTGNGGPKHTFWTVCHGFPWRGEIPEVLEEDALHYPEYPGMPATLSVCLGRISRYGCLGAVWESLGQEKAGSSEDGGSIALLGLKVDRGGIYEKGSLWLSPLVWAAGRLREAEGQREHMPVILSFEQYQRAQAELEEGLPEESAVTQEVMQRLYQKAAAVYLKPVFGEAYPESGEGVLVYDRYADKEAEKAGEAHLDYSDLPKSFITRDLDMVYHELKDRLFGRRGMMEMAVLDYIIGAYGEAHTREGWLNLSRRLDLCRFWEEGRQTERENFFGTYLDIERMPMGKWPSSQIPGLMSQLAVNLSTDREAEYGRIFTVNARDGAEKNTFLKEVIAGNVVERALLLAQYRDSDDAFEERHCQDGQITRNYFEFRDNRIKDYGMLVVTPDSAGSFSLARELSDAGKIGESLTAQGAVPEEITRGLDHVSRLFDLERAAGTDPDIFFTKFANDLAFRKEEGMWDRWGLIAADFGRKSGVTEFEKKVLQPYVASFCAAEGTDGRKKEYQKARRSFQNQYLRVENIKQEISKVSGARARFRERESRVLQEQDQLQQAIAEQRDYGESLQAEVGKLRFQIQQITAREPANEAKLEVLRSKCHKLGDRQQEMEKEAAALHQKITELEKQRTLKDSLLTAFKKKTPLSSAIEEAYEEYGKKKEELKIQEEECQKALARVDEQDKECRNLTREKTKLRKKASLDLEKIKKTGIEIARLDRTIQQMESKIQQLREEYAQTLDGARKINNPSRKMHILDQEYWEENGVKEWKNPWTTEEYNRERERLFYYALQLHKEFLLSSRACSSNLKSLQLMWSGEETGKARPLGTLFNTLFLLTPVVVTTFPAAGGFLAEMKKPGEIGYLIVDGGGRIPAHMALGGLYRSRRALVVGDWGQENPEGEAHVEELNSVLGNPYNQPYQSRDNSVRESTERLSSLGFTLTRQGETVWRACPLGTPPDKLNDFRKVEDIE